MQPLYPWQNHLWQHIIQIENRLPHAWIITGASGIGKTHFAKYLAAWLLCTNKTDQACGECRSCILQKTRQHPDYYEHVEGSAEEKLPLNMEGARLLKNKLSDTAQQGSARIVLIESAETLTTPAANALLKVIEEPPPGVYFILTTARLILIPVTLRSRCHLLHCPTPRAEESLEWLKIQSRSSEETIHKTLQWVSGSPLNALSLLKKSDELAQREQLMNDFLGVLSGKISALTIAHRWSSLEESDIFSLVEYVLRRAVRLACGVGGTQKSFNHVPMVRWFSLYSELILSRERLWKTPGLNRQLFWEHFLLQCEGI